MNKDFIDGMFVFSPHPKSPDFVKAVLSIKPEEFIKWLEANKDKINDKGFLSIQVLESQKGGWYVKLNEWKKTEQTVQSVATEEINPEDIPF